MKSNRGFTLVELLVVAAIIGILSAITVTVYQQHSTRAKVAKVMPILNSTIKQVMIDFNQHGISPDNVYNISGAGGGNAGNYVIPSLTSHMFYDNGSNWNNDGALVRISIPNVIGQAIPGYEASTDGTDGANNSIAIAFYADDEDGTYIIYCGRWDSTEDIYIPLEYLPSGCNNDDFNTIVTGN